MVALPRLIPRWLPLLLGLVALAAWALSDGTTPQTSAGQIGFQRGALSAFLTQPTSLSFGPDGRLYVAYSGSISALTLDAQGTHVTNTEPLATGLSNVLGIAFDPAAPPSPVTVYFSHQDPDATDGFNGTISRITGPDWEIEDVITGLPTSDPYLNHMTNGIAFDGAGRLFIAQGSATNTGLAAPGGKQTYWPETPLSAAILVADIHAPGFDGAITYAPAGPPADDNVDQISGDVDAYASGVRNPYDLLLHSNGKIYATDNGPLSGPVIGMTSLGCAQDGGDVSQSDELNIIAQGNYYGFPNRNRGRTDPRQCIYHAPQEGNGADFTAPLAILPSHCSCDGIAEYTSNAFAGEMQGDLIFVEFIRDNLRRGVLTADGTGVSLSTLDTDLDMPLDVTVGPTGIIYIAEYGANRITYLEPLVPPTTPATATATPGAATDTPTPPDTTPAPTSTPTPSSGATPTASATPQVLVGDANCDGVLNPIDAQLVLQLSAGLIGALPCGGAGDVNGDGQVNPIDAQLILQFAAGLIPALPPP